MNQPLYFRRFELFEIVVPCREELVALEDGSLPDWPELPVVLVLGHLSNGDTALGEMDRGVGLSRVEAALRKLAGLDLRATAPASHWGRADSGSGLPSLFPLASWETLGGSEFALLECLIYDALGKSLGVPVNFFWGGAISARVGVDFWCNRPSPERARGIARRAAGEGFRGLKMKAKLGETIIEVARAMREETGPTFRITIDPMCAWRSFAESTFIFEALERIGGYFQIEDPFPHTSIECWQQARRRFSLPIVWHARTPDIARTGFQLRIADAYNLSGSGSDFVFLARAAQLLGYSCWHGTSIELGVKQQFQLHAACAVGNATLGSDFCSLMVREATLTTPLMPIENGSVAAPRLPGLGVELDREAAERYTVASSVLELE